MEVSTRRAPAEARPAPLLEVSDLAVAFPVAGGERRVVTGVSYSIPAGRTLGVVGESGCGKSMTALALMGLVPSPGRVSGSMRFEGRELVGQPETEWRHQRGARVAMVFQEPMTSLNPVMQVGRQIAEAMVLHQSIGWGAAEGKAVELLDAVGIPSPKARAAAFPHQLSGGMRQRAMIAMALACRPALLIADEPTTALDVTIQAQILDLMQDLQAEIGMAIQFISHNLAVISEVSDEIIVMYAGRVVERAKAEELFAQPLHPYTRGLIATLPDPSRRVARLPVIPGGVPRPDAQISGCRFADRCPLADAACRAAEPPLEDIEAGHLAACFKARG
ncbi:peptide/nickel transport system ATP-binding protein [Rhizobiales bacterium GAS191]|nr:peptide/nickel transport system ATP-binding protein [Rhizobiales bacterium GAS113]SEC02971.1 peptide/nickel transport system ATP-binding protein [Rhizobiales bacterium GAS191]